MPDMSLSEIKITSILIAIHWIPLFIAAWVWPLRKFDFSFLSAITLLFTIAAWLIVLVCLPLFFDVRANGGQMTWFAAYMIYSLMTFGAVPAAIIAIHVFAGRSAGLWIRSRQRAHHVGNAS